MRYLNYQCSKCKKPQKRAYGNRLHIGVYLNDYKAPHYEFCPECYEQILEYMKRHLTPTIQMKMYDSWK